jgi:hypothetical protein
VIKTSQNHEINFQISASKSTTNSTEIVQVIDSLNSFLNAVLPANLQIFDDTDSTELLSLENYYWVDWPEGGWFSESWGWGHTIGCAVATFFYVIPGIIFLIAQPISHSNYEKKLAEAKKARSIAFRQTGCVWLASVLHLGGHPALPYRERVVLGLTREKVVFFNYKLNLLHSIPINQIHITPETRNIRTNSVGSTYTPKGSSFGTTTSTQSVHLHPDTLIFAFSANGNQITAEIDCRPQVDPLDFIHTYNQIRTHVI